MDAKRFDALAKTLNISAARRLDRLAAALATHGSRRRAVAAAVAGLGSLAGIAEPASGGKKKRKGHNKKKKDRKDKKPTCIPGVEEPCGQGCCDALNRPCCNGICCDFGWQCCGGDALGRICCQYGCLAPEYPDCCPPGRACGAKCCDEGLVCATDPENGGTACCAPGRRACHGRCCGPGEACCITTGDIPYCCAEGLKCKKSGGNTCCTGTPASPC